MQDQTNHGRVKTGSDIKLFVCCHQADQHVAKQELLYPIQVGTALRAQPFKGFLHDNEGEHISEKNRSYCELTAQYWAWKNISADYYGFFHYRRYLYPDKCARLPYRIEGDLSEQRLEQLGYSRFAETIEEYDVIVPLRENMFISVRQHYAAAPFHHKKDLLLIEQIIREQNPDYVRAMDRYLDGTDCYFGNIYIMKKEIFHQYCSWLFPILEEFDRRVDTSRYSAQELRVDGYLAERLLGIYLTQHRNSLRVGELPRVHLIPTCGTRFRQKMINFLLPPGSRRRSAIKQLGRRAH